MKTFLPPFLNQEFSLYNKQLKMKVSVIPKFTLLVLYHHNFQNSFLVSLRNVQLNNNMLYYLSFFSLLPCFFALTY